MSRTWFTLGAAMLALTLGMSLKVQASESVERVAKAMQEDEKLVSPGDLKIVAGKDEGHKSPTEVLTKAIKAAKDGKMDVLKTCWVKDAHDQLEYTGYYKNKEAKNIEIIAMHLATFDAAKLAELKQNTVGKYAVVKTVTENRTHLIRAVWNAKNWYLKDTYGDEYIRDYTAGLKEMREAIESGSGAKIKDKLDPWETDALELLVGVQEGVDPYDLLAKRLKSISTGEGAPQVFLSIWSYELAYWFNNPKAGEKEAKDKFLVLKFTTEYDWKKGETFNVCKVALQNTAQFHKRPGGKFKEWVQDYDYYYPDEEGGK
ncbi:MAG: hypothetical protein BroJett014_18600 [Planctomycetota bacterium]|nr:MAG: hypothetical protein BroJett014_18600 [Planctomycetota bacterium]